MKLPQTFIERTKPLLGNEFDDFLAALDAEKPTSIRLNTAKLSPSLVEKGLEGEVLWCNSGFYLPSRPIFTLDPLFHAGVYYVQEASSMFVEQVVKQYVKSTIRTLDLCAAPGGKSTHLVSLLPQGSLLVSNEYVRSRAFILSESLKKWGYSNTLVCNNTPRDLGKLPGFFDLMLVDAPCSGEGMFRKDESAITEWSPEIVQRCCQRQKQILSDAWDSLCNNGLLIYSTCTYNREENEAQVQWIIEELGAELLDIHINPEWGIVKTDFGYRFYPHKTKGEGFFLSVLRKNSNVIAHSMRNRKKNCPPLAIAGQARNDNLLLLKCPENYTLFTLQNTLVAYPAQLNEIPFLSNKLNVLHAGISLGEWKGKSFIPDAALALSVELDKSKFEIAEVDKNTALSFLRTENIVLPHSKQGIVLLTYDNHSVGFVKNLGKRCNSLYPLEWRIRHLTPTLSKGERKNEI